jgi:hypothetical protein
MMMIETKQQFDDDGTGMSMREKSRIYANFHFFKLTLHQSLLMMPEPTAGQSNKQNRRYCHA